MRYFEIPTVLALVNNQNAVNKILMKITGIFQDVNNTNRNKINQKL